MSPISLVFLDVQPIIQTKYIYYCIEENLLLLTNPFINVDKSKYNLDKSTY